MSPGGLEEAALLFESSLLPRPSCQLQHGFCRQNELSAHSWRQSVYC